MRVIIHYQNSDGDRYEVKTVVMSRSEFRRAVEILARRDGSDAMVADLRVDQIRAIGRAD